MAFALLFTTVFSSIAAADPPAPSIFPGLPVIRVTDIGAVNGQPNRFRIMFEVINWTNQDAYGLSVSLNVATTFLPTAAGATPKVKFVNAMAAKTGRPLAPVDVTGDGLINLSLPASNPQSDLEDVNSNGILNPGEDKNGNGRLDNDPIPGNVMPIQGNDWSVAGVTETNARWTAGTPLPKRDLLAATTRASICSLIPGCALTAGQPKIANAETVDDGPNVLDGFVLEVSDWEEGETLSFNWFLMGPTLPIGNGSGGSPYAFGVLSLIRLPYGYLAPYPDVWYAGTKGFEQSTTLFFDHVYLLPSAGAEFAEDIGRALTLNFLNASDAPNGSQANTGPDVTDTLQLASLVSPPKGATPGGGLYPITASFVNTLGYKSNLCFIVTDLSGGAVRVENATPPGGVGSSVCVGRPLEQNEKFAVMFDVRLSNKEPEKFTLFVKATDGDKPWIAANPEWNRVGATHEIVASLRDKDGKKVQNMGKDSKVKITIYKRSFEIDTNTGGRGAEKASIPMSMIEAKLDEAGDVVTMNNKVPEYSVNDGPRADKIKIEVMLANNKDNPKPITVLKNWSFKIEFDQRDRKLKAGDRISETFKFLDSTGKEWSGPLVYGYRIADHNGGKWKSMKKPESALAIVEITDTKNYQGSYNLEVSDGVGSATVPYYFQK